MYCKVLPEYKKTDKDDKNGDKEDVINADDPANQEIVQQMLFGKK